MRIRQDVGAKAMPTQAEIAAETAKIRATWSDLELLRRWWSSRGKLYRKEDDRVETQQIAMGDVLGAGKDFDSESTLI